jgi:hypothetical protein
MGYKIFVSYKYHDWNVFDLPGQHGSTVRDYVDLLERYFASDRTSHIYKGESGNEDLSDCKDNTIWEKLKDRITDSSITIVMISPNMREKTAMGNFRHDRSQWIPWEISYSLKAIPRNDRTSRPNAVLAVVLPDKLNSYAYFIEEEYCYMCSNCPNNRYRVLKTDALFDILKNNMFNRKEKELRQCEEGEELHVGDSSYILSVKWEDFAQSPNSYLNRATRIKDNIDDYDIQREV